MATRAVVIALMSAAVIAGAAGCGTSITPNASPAHPPPSAYVALDLTIDKGTVTPTNAALLAKVGQPIVVRVTTDEYDELAVGSSPDLRFDVDPRPRAPEVFQFTADVPGRVDVELLRMSGCPNRCARTHQLDKTVAAIEVQPSPATTTSPAPLSAGPTRVPCELLSPSVAKAFAGDDAQRQLSLDSNPPLPVGDHACFYQGSTRFVYFSINTLPSDPRAPVKNGLLLNFKVSDIPVLPGTQINQDRKAEDIKLADLIVAEVG
jgi:hypothetical protein